MRRPVIHILLVATLWVASAPARAQHGDLFDLNEAVARNEQLLAQATDLVVQTNSAKARTSLEAARTLHARSKELVSGGSNMQMAARVTAQARQAILNTISLAKREARLEEQAIKAMELAAARLLQARAAWEEAGSPEDARARKLLEEAHEQLQRARGSMHEHMFGVALQLAQSSAELSGRAIQMLKRASIGPDDVFAEIERTDAILERVAGRLGADRRGFTGRALDDARDLQNRARHNARNDSYRVALEQTRRARDLALRAMKSAAGTALPEVDEIGRAIAFTEDLLAQARDLAGADAPARVRQQLEEAAQLQEMARNRLAAGEPRAAREATLHARETLKRALRGLDRPIDAEIVRGALARTDEVLGRLESRLAGTAQGAAAALFERAQARQEGAWGAYENGEMQRALALTRVARNLAARAMKELGDAGG
ncbi:MAG: hypothetical protein OEO21_03250 [Candidatus Krumholzibacteria bacterium]|nr:hypothetical protein [Candidatus Krumholzibacteria bacterium]